MAESDNPALGDLFTPAGEPRHAHRGLRLGGCSSNTETDSQNHMLPGEPLPLAKRIITQSGDWDKGDVGLKRGRGPK